MFERSTNVTTVAKNAFANRESMVEARWWGSLEVRIDDSPVDLLSQCARADERGVSSWSLRRRRVVDAVFVDHQRNGHMPVILRNT